MSNLKHPIFKHPIIKTTNLKKKKLGKSWQFWALLPGRWKTHGFFPIFLAQKGPKFSHFWKKNILKQIQIQTIIILQNEHFQNLHFQNDDFKNMDFLKWAFSKWAFSKWAIFKMSIFKMSIFEMRTFKKSSAAVAVGAVVFVVVARALPKAPITIRTPREPRPTRILLMHDFGPLSGGTPQVFGNEPYR